MGMGFKEGRCKIKEDGDELMVSAETEEETEELESGELEDKGTGGSRNFTIYYLVCY